MIWVWLGFVASGGHWVLWLVMVVVGSNMEWICMEVVLGFDVVVSFLCVGEFGFCWGGFAWVLVWVVKLCCGCCCR